MSYITAAHIPVAKAGHMAIFVPKDNGTKKYTVFIEKHGQSCKQILQPITEELKRLLLTTSYCNYPSTEILN